MFARGTAIVTAAAICAGGFAMMSQPSASEGVHVGQAKISDRHPAYEGRETGLNYTVSGNAGTSVAEPQVVAVATKGDLGTDRTCSGQTWPLIDASCLEAADGTEVPAAVRTVSIDDRIGESTSVVMRTASTVTAAVE